MWLWGQTVLARPEKSRAPAACAKRCQSATGFHSMFHTRGCGQGTRNTLAKDVETHAVFQDAEFHREALIDFVSCCLITSTVYDALNIMISYITSPPNDFKPFFAYKLTAAKPGDYFFLIFI